MVELKGSLSSIGLPAIVQLIGELHHSGNLELTRGAHRGVLGFDDGSGLEVATIIWVIESEEVFDAKIVSGLQVLSS